MGFKFAQGLPLFLIYYLSIIASYSLEQRRRRVDVLRKSLTPMRRLRVSSSIQQVRSLFQQEYNCGQQRRGDLSSRCGRVFGMGKYLGLPSMISRKKKAVFNFLKDRIQQKYQNWTGKHLSKVGHDRNACEASCSIHPSLLYEHFFHPNVPGEEMEKIINSFWQGSNKEWAGNKLDELGQANSEEGVQRDMLPSFPWL